MASMGGRDELLIDVEGLRATVETLTMCVVTLTTDVNELKGLMASHDEGVYGEAYADDTGPVVRAKLFGKICARH